MSIYPDTSFYFSLYGGDSNSTRADSWRRSHPVPLPFTAFHRVELRNALSLAVFQGRMSVTQVAAVWSAIESDLSARILVSRIGLWHRVMTKAENIAKDETPEVGCRSLDVIHVAITINLGSVEFCTFDTRQAGLARRMGMTVSALEP